MNYEIKTLDELGTFSKGKGITKAQLVSHGIPCIRYGEIYTKHHFIIKKYYSYISQEVASESQLIKKGDILFAGSGETIDDIGKTVAFISDDVVYAGSDIIVFTPKNTNSIFLAYLLETEFVKKQKRVLGQGNSVVHIYPSDIKQLQLPIPELSEQQRIAAILTTQDQIIENYELMLEQQQLMKKGLMEELLINKMNQNSKL